MTPPVAAVRIVGKAGDPAVVAAEAARHAFPSALVTRTEKLSDVAEGPVALGPELLVLLTPDLADVKHALAAHDNRGRPRWAVVACGAPAPDGNPPAISVSPEDWTEPMVRLALVSAVRLCALTSVNAQLRGDLRTVSRRLGHDMRGPLNAIATANEALTEHDHSSDSGRNELGQTIASSVDEAVRLLDRVNFILKATTDPQPQQSVIMGEIVWGALQRLESRMAKLGVAVSQPEKWPVISGVPAWIDVIWSNLLANSLDHAGPRPGISLGWEQLPGECLFWLEDQGAGVPAKKEALLFFPLDRLGELNAPRGFGLAIVRRLVELQGGRCGHERTSTGRSKFYFALPDTEA